MNSCSRATNARTATTHLVSVHHISSSTTMTPLITRSRVVYDGDSTTLYFIWFNLSHFFPKSRKHVFKKLFNKNAGSFRSRMGFSLFRVNSLFIGLLLLDSVWLRTYHYIVVPVLSNTQNKPGTLTQIRCCCSSDGKGPVLECFWNSSALIRSSSRQEALDGFESRSQFEWRKTESQRNRGTSPTFGLLQQNNSKTDQRFDLMPYKLMWITEILY